MAPLSITLSDLEGHFFCLQPLGQPYLRKYSSGRSLQFQTSYQIEGHSQGHSQSCTLQSDNISETVQDKRRYLIVLQNTNRKCYVWQVLTGAWLLCGYYSISVVVGCTAIDHSTAPLTAAPWTTSRLLVVFFVPSSLSLSLSPSVRLSFRVSVTVCLWSYAVVSESPFSVLWPS